MMSVYLGDRISCTRGLIFILLLHHSLQYGSGLCTDHDVTNTALVNILLDETTGPNCDEIRLGAIQERAAIEYAVHSVNAALKRDGFNMKIKANTFDTCSNTKNVKKVVLKALVTSEQTCPEPPLLLGFIGPQNNHLLNETKKVTNVFSSVHILGNRYQEDDYDRNVLENEDTLYLYDNYVQQKYEIILTTLKKINWSSFILIVDESELSVNIGNQFLTARNALQSNPCVVGDILKLPRDKADVYNFYKKLLLELEEGHQDGLVIIVNEMSRELAEFLRKFGTEHPTILSVNRVGIGAWQIPQNNQFFLLQEVSNLDMASEFGSYMNKTAWALFVKQQEAQMKSTMCINKDDVECDRRHLTEDILYQTYDASVLTHIYSLNLLATTLKSLQRLKCKAEVSKHICSKLVQINKPEDLNTNIRRVTMMYSKDYNIRFNMNADPMVQIYNVDLMDNQLKLVAKVRSKQFELLKNMKLPVKPFPNDDGAHYTKRNPNCRQSELNNSKNHDGGDWTGSNDIDDHDAGAARPKTIAKKKIPSLENDLNGKLDEDTTVKTIVMSTQTSRPSIWNFIPNVRNLETTDDYFNIAVVFITVGAAFFLFMLCAICCLWKIFRVKGDHEDRESYDNRSIRSVESGMRVKVARRKRGGKRDRNMNRNESVRSARSDD